MIIADLLADLEVAEGLRLHAYQDTLGIWTIGYGHAHVAPGTVWTQPQAAAALLADINHAVDLCNQFIPWWKDLNNARQGVMAELMFNMGWLSKDGEHGLGTFHNTLRLVEDGKFSAASTALLSSHWAAQVKGRAQRLAQSLKTGVRVPA